MNAGNPTPDTATQDLPTATTGGCGCGKISSDELPELDARLIPQQVRHAAILGALESVAPGTGLVLVAPHDPVPLLNQVHARWPGAFQVEYRERGPQAWRVALIRTTA